MVSDINIKGTNHKVGGSQADGQWVQKRVTVFSSQNWSATGTQTYTISDYLPDNIYTYEILVSCYATTGATSGNICTWWVQDIDNHFDSVMGYCRTRTASNVASGNSCILPVKQVNGVLTFKIHVTNTGALGGQGLYVTAYRRLGGSSIPPTYYTLTINPTPADATVTFNKGTVVGKTCTVTAGTSVTYTVSKSGYTTQSGTVTVNSDQTVNVILEQGYIPNQVLYESSTGGASTTLNLLVSGKYQVICVAGGGGGAGTVYSTSLSTAHRAGGGGSGSGFNCVFQLSAGSYAVAVGKGGTKATYTTTSGGTAGAGGDSRFGTCYARGGKGGKAAMGGTAGGAGGAAPTLTYTRTTTTLNTAGNAGGNVSSTSTASGGAAVYSSYGKGGNGHYSNSVNGTAGYVKVIYIGE